MAMTVAREVTKASLPEIGCQFGILDHTSVLHGIDRTFRRTRTDESTALEYTILARLSRDMANRRRARERAWVQEALALGQIIPAQLNLEAAE